MAYQFNAPDADVVLLSCEPDKPAEFHVHRCILAAASPFFHDMFTLPQPTSAATPPTIPMSEPAQTLDALLRFVYPVADPPVPSLDALVPILASAHKYDFPSALTALRALLISPALLTPASALRVFAIATRFDLEPEARAASRHTLATDILTAPLSDDLRHISAYAYRRLLDLHRRRAAAACALLCLPDDIKCMQCNGSALAMHATPKWWQEWERRARVELEARPVASGGVLFTMQFMAGVLGEVRGCSRCAGSVLDSWRFLDELREKIDALPDTI